MRAISKVLVVVSFSLLLLGASVSLVLAQSGDVENGKALFGEYCAVCHGYDGQGRVGASLEGWFTSISPEAFIEATVRDGVASTMPAFSLDSGGPLTDQEIGDISTYILSWRERVDPAPTPTPVPVTPIPKIVGVTGDPTAGVQVFARECQVCHGEQGRGGVGASLSGPIAAAQPAAFLRQAIGGGIEGSPMPAFKGALGEDEIENVVAFIMSWDHKPVSSGASESEQAGDFNWLIGLLFLGVVLVVVAWLVTRFSQRKTST